MFTYLIVEDLLNEMIEEVGMAKVKHLLNVTDNEISVLKKKEK